MKGAEAPTATPRRRTIAAIPPAAPAEAGATDVYGASIDLYWLPLGAGGHSVRWNGRVYEAIAARHEHRAARDLYHSALEVRVDGQRYVIEMAPVWNEPSRERGAVCEGAVGASWLGRFRWFRYEVRCWRDGHIPDVAEAVFSPQRLGTGDTVARQLIATVPLVPPLVWGRDQLRCGDMWNSNSLPAWLLARCGLVANVGWPPAGRAPGWDAGLRLAERQGSVEPTRQFV